MSPHTLSYPPSIQYPMIANSTAIKATIVKNTFGVSSLLRDAKTWNWFVTVRYDLLLQWLGSQRRVYSTRDDDDGSHCWHYGYWDGCLYVLGKEVQKGDDELEVAHFVTTWCLQLEIWVEIGKYVKGGRLGISMNEYFILSKSTSLLNKALSEVKTFTHFIHCICWEMALKTIKEHHRAHNFKL